MEDGRPRPSSTALHQSERKEVLKPCSTAALMRAWKPCSTQSDSGNNAASFFRILPYNYLANVSPKSCASRN